MTTDSTISPELLDQLLANYTKPEDLTGETIQLEIRVLHGRLSCLFEDKQIPAVEASKQRLGLAVEQVHQAHLWPTV